MIKLSDRLQVIADEIKPGETVADIGTDHGLLPIFLYESGRSPAVILCDINRGPLDKAGNNIAMYLGEGALRNGGELRGLELRLGDGLKPLASGEVDTVVIAGMGGILMTEILGEKLTHSRSFSKLILQPRNGSHKLRWWLAHNGFRVTAEHLVVERKYICEVVTVQPESAASAAAACPAEQGGVAAGLPQAAVSLPEEIPDEALDWEISPLLFDGPDPLLIPFIENKIRIEEKVVGFVSEGSQEGTEHERIAEANRRLAALRAKLALARQKTGTI